MQKLQFKKEIKASAQCVYEAMLGINDINTYQQWTAAFNPTSSYEGSWEKGSKIYFIGLDEKGNKGGMVSEVEENIPAKFVSICHYGFLSGDEEITTGPLVEKWAGGHENYHFEEQNGITNLMVEIDVEDEYLDFFKSTYPKALDILKNLVEQ